MFVVPNMSGDVLALPKVLLLGLRRSGKSSIQKVVFEDLQPHESINLPTTVRPDMTTIHSNDFIHFEVWDFPGQTDPFSECGTSNSNSSVNTYSNHGFLNSNNSFIAYGHHSSSGGNISNLHDVGAATNVCHTGAGGSVPYDVHQLLENCGAIVFVMDCRELIDDARARLLDTICAAYHHNPELSIEVFIHKVDALSEDHQADLLANLQRRVKEEARQRLDVVDTLRLNFSLTSIYDHSVFQAFSIVVQRLITNKTGYITEVLQMMNSNSNIDLSYLFVSCSKIYLAVDERNRLKSHSYDLCSDAIEVMIKMGRIYEGCVPAARSTTAPSSPLFIHSSSTSSSAEAGVNRANAFRDGAAAAAMMGLNHVHTTRSDNELTALALDELNTSDAAALAGAVLIDAASTVAAKFTPSCASAIISLGSDDCMYVRELPNSFTLILMLKQADFEHRVLIDRNIDIFYKAVRSIFGAQADCI